MGMVVQIGMLGTTHTTQATTLGAPVHVMEAQLQLVAIYTKQGRLDDAQAVLTAVQDADGGAPGWPLSDMQARWWLLQGRVRAARGDADSGVEAAWGAVRACCTGQGGTPLAKAGGRGKKKGRGGRQAGADDAGRVGPWAQGLLLELDAASMDAVSQVWWQPWD